MANKKMAIKKPKVAGPGPKIKIFGTKPYPKPTTEAEFRANDEFTDKRMTKIGRAVGGLTVGGTVAALLNSEGGRKVMKKTGKAIVGGVKKGVQAIKNIRGTGEYVSNPDTGKMERVKKPNARSMRRAEKKSK